MDPGHPRMARLKVPLVSGMVVFEASNGDDISSPNTDLDPNDTEAVPPVAADSYLKEVGSDSGAAAGVPSFYLLRNKCKKKQKIK